MQKRKWKRAASVLLSAVMAVTMPGLTSLSDVPRTAKAASDIDLSDVTAFVFDGDTVTVTEGNDANYEVVVYDDTDTETDADTATDDDGNKVYSLPDGSSGQLLVSIKKKGGSYTFSGSGNGSIAVKKEAEADAVLYLNGLTLTSSFTAVINVKKDSTASCTIYAVDGTVNTLTDNAYNNEDTYADNAAAENAVIKCKDASDVTITGAGTLNIIGNAKNGIKANNLLAIDSAALSITAVDNGISGENSIVINSGTFAITTTGGDGIKAVTDLTLTDGTFDLNTAEDALQSDGSLTVSGGTYSISAGDDAIHADGTTTVGTAGGSDSDLTISIASCVEGIEGATVNFYSGTCTIYSSDDSINAANSDLTDYTYELNIAGGMIYAASTNNDCLDSNGNINISGGTVVALGAINNTTEVNAALDCDGTLTITGGTVLAVGMQEMTSLPGSGSQSYAAWTAAGSTTALSGGSSSTGNNGNGGFAFRQAGREDFGGNNPSGSGEMDFGGKDWNQSGSSGFVSDGDVLTVSDADGNVLFTATANWNSTSTSTVNYVLYSEKGITSGTSYTLAVNGSTQESDTATATEASAADTTPTATETPTTTETDTEKTAELEAPVIYRLKNKASGVKMTWNTVSGASGYYVYRKDGKDGTYQKIAQISDSSLSFYVNQKTGTNKVKNGETYYYKVAAYTDDGTEAASVAKKICYLRVAVLKSVKTTSNVTTVRWKQNKKADGYQIQYAASKSFSSASKKQVKGAQQTAAKIKTGKASYVRIRTYKTVNGKKYYSAWSKVKVLS